MQNVKRTIEYIETLQARIKSGNFNGRYKCSHNFEVIQRARWTIKNLVDCNSAVINIDYQGDVSQKRPELWRITL